jgi:5-methyltetrahydropteroyltriglutamate--homocysteine methyltransferase
MSTRPRPPLFPTTVIGSLPRPGWVSDLVLDRKANNVDAAEAWEKLHPACEAAIKLQEQAGLDELTDGEWRRESYVKVFAEKVHGFTDDLLDNAGNARTGKGPGAYPAVTSALERRGRIVADEIEFSRSKTTRRLKCTLPSPYIMGNRMWSKEHSSQAYPNREDFMAACVPILREEILLVKAAGADIIQLDEPWVALLVDPVARESQSAQGKFSRPIKGDADVAFELDLCVEMMNRTLDGIEGIDTGMHLCHAHFAHEHGSQGSYEPIMDALGKIRVGTVSLEYATPVSFGVSSLRMFPANARLGLGCVDHCDRNVETAAQIVARVEAAMEYVPKERISLHPDCGFAPSVQNPVDLEEASAKLGAMCEAARLLRAKYGGDAAAL